MPSSDADKTYRVEKRFVIKLPGWVVPRWVLRRLGPPQNMQRTLEGSEVEYAVEHELRIGGGADEDV
jgi:hypothetical protein